MKKIDPADPPLFDHFAEDYDQALQQGLSVSGEGKEFFARERVNWLSQCLRAAEREAGQVLDFGCGTGSATPFLLSLPGVQSLTGVVVSTNALQVAERKFGSAQVRFCLAAELPAERQFDLAFSNGVFHHIPPAERGAAVDLVLRALRPSGLFALWENNPWNPGTRYVMSRIPFDRDAIPLSIREAKRLLRSHGFEVVRRDFLFIFPRFLRRLRPLEFSLTSLPIGAQYQLLVAKPSDQDPNQNQRANRETRSLR